MITFSLDRSALGPTMTPGTLTFPDVDSIFATLELPWKNNAPRISCIPAGSYRVQFGWSTKHAMLMPFLVDVPGRSEIEIHTGDTVKDSLGCILVATIAASFAAGDSRTAFGHLYKWLADRTAKDHVFIDIQNPPTFLPAADEPPPGVV